MTREYFKRFKQALRFHTEYYMFELELIINGQSNYYINL